MKKLYKVMIPTILILAMIISWGCSTSKSTAPMSPPAPGIPSAPSGLTKESADVSVSRSSTGGESSSTIDRKIVKTGRLTMLVENIVESLNKISSLANELGGYVVSSNKYETDEGTGGRISIRVPAQTYDQALDKLRRLAEKVPSETTDSRDVTEEFTDLKARLKTLEATEAQYLILLNRAQTVEDILKVQRELTNIRQQIEQTKGRIQYLERTSDMSIIEITLKETKSLQGKGWNALETLKSAIIGLIAFGKVVIDIIIWFMVFIPLWIIIFIIIIFVKRIKKKAKIQVLQEKE